MCATLLTENNRANSIQSVIEFWAFLLLDLLVPVKLPVKQYIFDQGCGRVVLALLLIYLLKAPLRCRSGQWVQKDIGFIE